MLFRYSLSNILRLLFEKLILIFNKIFNIYTFTYIYHNIDNETKCCLVILTTFFEHLYLKICFSFISTSFNQFKS